MANEEKLSLKYMCKGDYQTNPSIPRQFMVDEASFTETSQLIERVIYALPN